MTPDVSSPIPVRAGELRKQIAYKKGYKYQLQDDYFIIVPIHPPVTIVTEFITLYPTGLLVIRAGYAWDGPSGPAIDTDDFMRGSLVHDALYQLLRAMLLPPECRAVADQILADICAEDGMWAIRVWWVHKGVAIGAGPAADPNHEKPVIYSPAPRRKP